MVPELPVEWYFQHILPPLPAGADLDVVLELLREDGVIIGSESESGDRWPAFGSKLLEPCLQSTDLEENFLGLEAEEGEKFEGFGILEALFDAVIDASREQMPSLEQRSTMIFPPREDTLFSEGAGGSNDQQRMPPAFFVSVSGLDCDCEKSAVGQCTCLYPNWHEMLNPCYFEEAAGIDEEHTQAYQNNSDKYVLEGMQDILSKDPCRQFTFGTTIVRHRDSNSMKMRLWIANRAVILKTEPFDFLMNPRLLIHLFIVLACSSYTDLGWDPSINCISESRLSSSPMDHNQKAEPVYTIQVNGRTYTTVQVLADFSTNRIVCPATRVWLVQDCRGKRYVLKDVWINVSREPEHVIRNRILEDVEVKCGIENCEILKERMLTPVTYAMMDRTDCMMRMDDCIVGDEPPESSKESIDFEELLGPVSHKYHYRVVFQEYATTVLEEKSYMKVFVTLADVLRALEIMHRAGWVHRDVSGGNVYSYEANGTQRGLLGDFEYAKNDQDVEESRLVGTADFIACETALRLWLFKPALSNDSEDPDKIQPIPFAPNPLHDLESLWWILVFIMFDTPNLIQDSASFVLRSKVKRKLFPGKSRIFQGLHLSWRLAYLKDPTMYDNGRSGLSSSLSPVNDVVRQIGGLIVQYYREAEKFRMWKGIDAKDFTVHEKIRALLEGSYRDAIAHIHIIRGLRVRMRGVVMIIDRGNLPSLTEIARLQSPTLVSNGTRKRRFSEEHEDEPATKTSRA